MLSVILFIVGFLVLIQSARFLVDGATSVSERLGLSRWIMGVLVVGIGTSIPEFSINIVSAINSSDVGVGTILGSNTFNILFILGIAAIISPPLMRREWVRRDFVLNAFSVLLAGMFLIFPIFGDKTYVGITYEEALAVFICFVAWVFYMVVRKPGLSVEENSEQKGFSIIASMSMMLAGFLGVFFGAQWVVSGAINLAIFLGISAHTIGLSVLAVGTSIPEMVVSLIAALKGRTEIAVGNVIGSNIFDFLGIIGTSGLVARIPFDTSLYIDILMTVLATTSLFVAMFVGRQKYVLSRSSGVLFTILYCVYFVTIIMRAPFN